MNLMVQEELQNKLKDEEDKVDAEIKKNEEATSNIQKLEDEKNELQKKFENAELGIKKNEAEKKTLEMDFAKHIREATQKENELKSDLSQKQLDFDNFKTEEYQPLKTKFDTMEPEYNKMSENA